GTSSAKTSGGASCVHCFDFMMFFFSSRRRHTRSKRDWSSDVCSSDLSLQKKKETLFDISMETILEKTPDTQLINLVQENDPDVYEIGRASCRKECRCRGRAYE